MFSCSQTKKQQQQVMGKKEQSKEKKKENITVEIRKCHKISKINI